MRRPPDPRLALLAAALAPGAGHVLIGRAGRGLGFAFFTLLLGWLSTKIAPDDASFLGRHAAGAFVWALSLPDAYRAAALDRRAARHP
ncbi:hypothetical protein ACFQ4O_04535 [Methylopila musalis]|uniref:Uncharacterized protein n=1 Tax=Methylopila musalis TaxID=1134781 RepID=A0ABW3Z4Q9_9HYPH